MEPSFPINASDGTKNNDRDELLVDTGEEIYRVQCKTGWIEDGCVRFKTVSKPTRNGELHKRGYAGDIHAFAVRCQDDETLYWVPEPEPGRKNTYLRRRNPEVDHPHVNPAEEYRFDSNCP